MIYYGNSTYYNSDFSHFGVKGMKWGVRRYQNEDGSLTAAGKKRYSGPAEEAYKKYTDAKAQYKKATKKYHRETMYGLVEDTKASKDLQKAARAKRYAKEDLKDIKLDQQMSKHKPSKHELDLAQKYKDQGMPEHDAQVAAYKRARTEKIMKVAAVTAIAAAATYVAYKHYDTNVDHIIRKGTTLQNISLNADKENIHDFYSSRGVKDGLKYQGLYGNQLRTPRNAFGMPVGEKRDVYRTRFKVDKNIKIASQRSAVETLSELVNNDNDFKDKLMESLKAANGRQPNSKQNEAVAKGLASLRSGRIDSNVYDAMNIDLVAHDPVHQEISDKFFNALRAKGYGAVRDSNDTKLSGYNARTATIIFGKGGNMHVEDRHKLSDSEIDKPLDLVANKIPAIKAAGKAAMPTAAEVAAIYGGTKVYMNTWNRNRVKQYRKDHPNSTMSNREIERLLDHEYDY